MPAHLATPCRVALVTGASRTAGIAASIIEALARDGWDIGFTYWQPYDDRMPWGIDTDGPSRITEAVERCGQRAIGIAADLSQPEQIPGVFDSINSALGPVTGLITSHCESVNASTLDTSIESFDRHYAVNVRATWLLIREFAQRFPRGCSGGRIITLTSDHVVGDLAYGASKAAADRVTLAASGDLAHLGITANAINPGPIDTGWMTPALRDDLAARTPLKRLGNTSDAANLVRFLCSLEGEWISGQLLLSNGGFKPTIA